MPRVVVEFYGLARFRAGCGELAVAAGTVREVLEAAGTACPSLHPLRDGRIASEFLVSLNGTCFLTNTSLPLPEGSRLLVFGADAGG